ncbi:Uu.00g146730.m01.CDS01 [Anthostomella pinea]|uniref:Uu.00g146730.m01.CDS01 n=1 Tax=Anthostomella pinea TaxID=933095 RepID=A0AAI8YLY6_9PEZI|nr:Uu.00g146730.m01.CDS01 [Anthostomella pinea]
MEQARRSLDDGSIVRQEDIDNASHLTAAQSTNLGNALSRAWGLYKETSQGRSEQDYRRDILERTSDSIRISLRKPNISSFTTKRTSPTTFVIQERDAYKEHPLIYAKLHPKADVVVLTDTGCDEPDEQHKTARYIHLREYLEHCPVSANHDKPINPDGKRRYIIIQTHCHYDHTFGIPQFLSSHGIEIVASAAGRDFFESDLTRNGEFEHTGRPTPDYQVSKWAEAFEQLKYPFHQVDEDRHVEVDMGMTVLHTPGHTPDELAWYDHEEMHLYVGDSFYREGEDGLPIIFPVKGSLIEWVFSMQKLAVFVRGENARAASVVATSEQTTESDEDDWVHIPQPTKARRVLVSCAHQTYAVDSADVLAELEAFSFQCFIGKVPVVDSQTLRGETFDTWREKGDDRTPMSIQAPRRLMEEARKFFGSRPGDASRMPFVWE